MATRSKFFRVPFGLSGDLTAIPDPTQVGGEVSFTQGYGPDYQRDQTSDPLAKPIERQGMNYLLNQMTQALKFWQTESFPEWIAAADNNGVAFPYEIGTVVRWRATGGDPFKNYRSRVANNTALPSDATAWGPVLANGNYSGFLSKSANFSLLASQAGSYVAVTVANIAATLPPGSSVDVGTTYTIGTQGRLTIQRDPGTTDTIAGAQGTAASVTVGGFCSVVWRGDIWQIVMGGDQVVLAAAGYQKLASGLIIQWGALPAIAANSYAQVAFPIAFPTATVVVNGLPGSTISGSGSGLSGYQGTGGVGGNTLTGCSFINTSATAGTLAGTYFAIGY